MKAIYYDSYGSPDVLRYGELPQPVPQPDQVLVRVRASSVNPVDWKMRQDGPGPLFGPAPLHKIPGCDVAGEVVALGADVTRFPPGARVFGVGDGIPGIGGTAAEYLAVRATSLAYVPNGLSFAEAASVPLGALTSLQGLRDHGQLLSGKRVLILGASGGVGTMAVQIARALGAGEITGTCSPEHAGLVRELGADRTLDYHDDEFLRARSRYDLIFDAAGKSSFTTCAGLLRDRGRFVTTAPKPLVLAADWLASAFTDKKVRLVFATRRGTDLALIAAWLRAGALRPVISRTFPLAETAAAHRLSEQGSGGGAGRIVLEVG